MNILLLNVKLLTETLSDLKRMPEIWFDHKKNDLEGRFMFKLTSLPDQSCVLFDKLDRK